MRLKLLIYMLLFLPAVAYTQTIIVRSVDASAYPTISAEVHILDADEMPVTTASASDLDLSVRGIPTPVQSISCPPPQPPLPMWAVVACDRSQSMDERINDDLLCIDLASAGMSSFIKTVDFSAGDTRVALMVFDTAASVLINFSNDAILLGTKVGGIEPIDVAGTNYTRAFLDPFQGAITLLKRVPPGYERILVLLSDGAPTAGDFDFATILREVLDNNIVVYPIIVKRDLSYELQQIAVLSGGQGYGGITSRDSIRSIYTRIAKRAQITKEPCTITWTADVCDTNKTQSAVLRFAPLNVSAAFSYTINKPLKLAKVDAGRDTTICAGSTLTLRAVGNSPGGRYKWLPEEGLSDPSSPSPVLTPTAESTTYSVVFTDERGCTATDNVSVRVLTPTVALAVDSVFICRGESSTLVAASNGTRFQWSPTVGMESGATSATAVVRPDKTTTYTLTAWVGSCPVTDSIVVVVYDLQNAIDAGNDVALCADSSTILVPSGVEGRYFWFPAEGLDRTDIRNPVARPLQTTTYYLVVTTASGCTASDSVTITVHPRATVSAGSDTDICPGKSVTLSAVGGEGEYTWSPATGLSNSTGRSVVASPLVTTVYTVLYTDPNGCKATDEVAVVVNGALSVDAGEEQSICPGGSAQLALAGSNGSVLWTPATGLSNPTSRTPVASPSVTTVYTAVVTSAEGCIGIDSVRVVVYPTPTISAGDDATLCRGEQTQLRASGSEGVYLWSPTTDLSNPSSPDPIASPSKTTTYTVTVTDANGCTTSDQVVVNVRSYADVKFSLVRKKSSKVELGQSDEFVLQVSGIDPTQDVISSFECVLSYDMESLQYVAGSIAAGMAAAGWQVSAVESPDLNQLVLRGSGSQLQSGPVCSFALRLYLSQKGASAGVLKIDALSATVQAEGCVTTNITATALPIAETCILAARAIRYTGKGFSLQQNTPNPAQSTTTFEFSVAFDAPTSLTLYNTLGEQVIVAVDGVLKAGSYSVEVPVNSLPSGLYYYRFTSGPYSETRQMIIGK